MLTITVEMKMKTQTECLREAIKWMLYKGNPYLHKAEPFSRVCVTKKGAFSLRVDVDGCRVPIVLQDKIKHIQGPGLSN